MAIGPGKYDDLATHARVQSEAGFVLLLILGGKHGSGFSIQLHTPLGETLDEVPRMLEATRLLRTIANGLEGEAQELLARRST